ncbi:hypothetical protein [Microtetraspora fusca]|uniref:hypothetical protein n=1 Tax=Microtetraspora fusca TaxID=1997 RepID=UPI0012F79214|nr:hypothetical protein [Microtetraspora fusca]
MNLQANSYQLRFDRSMRFHEIGSPVGRLNASACAPRPESVPGRCRSEQLRPEKNAAPIIMGIYTNRTPGFATDNKTIAKTATILARGSASSEVSHRG